MLPPAQMLAKKNRASSKFNFLLALLVLLIPGCLPPGTRALRDGARLLQTGQYGAAVEKLKLATSLLATNAQAWNYLGLAYHRSGQVTNAAMAYNRALSMNHDLMEARYNLGTLWLEQNNLEGAKSNLTVYTLRRGKAVEGWLKLGTAYLRGGDASNAEKCFNQALQCSAQNPEALNGLGLVQLQRNHPREAARQFAAALKQRPAYGPALLNLAIVNQRYLYDRAAALQNYQDYLALKPPPPNAEAVRAVALSLEQALAPKPRPALPGALSQAPSVVEPARAQPQTEARPGARSEPAPVIARTTPAAPSPPPASLPPPGNPEVVRLAPEPIIRTAPASTNAVTMRTTVAQSAASSPSPSSTAQFPEPPRRAFLQRVNPLNLFRKTPKESAGATPLPSAGKTIPPTAPDASQDMAAGSPAPSSGSPQAIPRYSYLSPARPADGNRAQAERALAQGAQAQRANRLAEAAQAYRQAAQFDPGYFDAQYRLALALYQARDYRPCLAACELALAIRPDSADARYDFALALKSAGYILDAVNELERILATDPNKTQAHLALGNLYAQQLGDPARARGHYLRVLELDPRHAQASDIRFWLVANPP